MATSEGATVLVVNREATFTASLTGGTVANTAAVARVATLPQALELGQTFSVTLVGEPN